METLRWSSLGTLDFVFSLPFPHLIRSTGYHFQWTPRVYTNEHRGEFPSDLNELVKGFASRLGYSMTAEAAIINFYPTPKCYMGAHLGMLFIKSLKGKM